MINYIKQSYKTIVLCLVFILTFFLVLLLSNIGLNVILYPLLLCLGILLIYCIFDFFKFKEKHTELVKLNESLGFEDMNISANNPIELEYNKILARLYEFQGSQIEKLQKSNNNYKEYLMLWTHQIKTPLSVLDLMVQKLENNRAYKEEIFHINRYVDMMLKFLKLDDINSDFNFEMHNIGDIVNSCVRFYRSLFISSQLGISIFDVDRNILTDRRILSFALEQLLSNAIKYSNKGIIKIYMQGNDLIVEDEGIGIAAEDLPRIFHKGFSGNNGRLNQKSTGIGLYLSHTMLSKIQHGLSCQSVQGQGTKMIISLPPSVQPQ